MLFVLLGFLAFGLPEFFSDTISQWPGSRMLCLLVADTLVGTAFFLIIWVHARKPLN